MSSTESTSLAGEAARRFDLGAWLVLALAVGYIVAAVAYVLLAYQQPTDGWLYTSGVSATVITLRSQSGAPSPLRPGDQFVAVNGAAVPSLSYRPLPPPEGWRLGGSVRYTVLRDGASIELDVPLTTRPASELLWYTLGIKDGAPWRLLKVLCWYLIGFSVFLLRPRSSAARLLLLIVVYWATYDAIINADNPVSIAFYPPALFWYRFGTQLLWPLLFTMALHLVLTFPVRSWPLTRWPRGALALLYGLPTVGVGVGAVLASDALALGSMFLMMALLVVALLIITISNQWRSREPVVRAQVSWVTLGLLAQVVSTILIQAALALNLVPAAIRAGRVLDIAGDALALLLPLCLGVAITRYRLFDIDVIIRRTLVYTVLTISLGAVYFGGVALLQALFVRLTGQESTLAVVASTLAIAALFLPLRARVQAFIDRRFFRRRYDARLVLAAFARRAQQEAEVEALSTDILATVQEALEPGGAALWLAQARQSSSIRPEKSA